MIEYIKGKVDDLNPAAVVLEDAAGIGFRIMITLGTFAVLEGKNEARLYVHEVIREDAWTLYGFADRRERELFRALIGVSGVGSATAVLILSSLQGEELAATIGAGNVRRLKAIKGIGTKTAERIIVDLKDKIGDVTVAASEVASKGISTPDYDEALAALTMLGFDRHSSQKVLDQLFENDPTLTVETAIKRSLSMLH